jgi:pimeloyl-ACP methyl ester carboxylesterase
MPGKSLGDCRTKRAVLARLLPFGAMLPGMFITCRAGLGLCILSAAVALGGCGNAAGPTRSLRLSECRLPNLSTLAQCGEIEVPEDRSKPDSRKIKIFAAVLPANTLSPKEDPLLILAGGPGQAASTLAPFASRLNEVRRARDVILIDQRGTGRSSPLDCAAFKPRDDDALETDPVPRARQCVLQLRAQGIDAAQYTTTAWIADLEAMRTALGYAQWNLWGGSYGTRVALEYLRRYPDHVRTMTLDGVAPPSMIVTLDIWRTRQAMLDAVFRACVESAACKKTHPDPAATLAEIARSLGPAGRDVDGVNPRTGGATRLHITFDVILALLQPLTYAPELSSLLPEMLSLAAAGNYGPLFSATQSYTTNIAEQMNAALHYSVTCAEDVPRITPQMQQSVLAGLPTRGIADNVIAVCGVWPRGTAPADFAQPVASDKPALLFSGGMDPVTPPAYADLVAKTLSNNKQIVAPGYGHIVSPNVCGPRLISAFVDEAGFGKLSESCIAYFQKSMPPPLWPDRLEPQP